MHLQDWFDFSDCHTNDLLSPERIRLKAEHCVCAAGEPGDPGAFEEIVFATTLLIPSSSLSSPLAAYGATSLDDVALTSLMADPSLPPPSDHPLSRLRESFAHRMVFDTETQADPWALCDSLKSHLGMNDAGASPTVFGDRAATLQNVYDISKRPLRVYSDASLNKRQISIKRSALEDYLQSQSCLMFFCSYRYRAFAFSDQGVMGKARPSTVRRLNDNQIWRGQAIEQDRSDLRVIDYVSELYSQGWVTPAGASHSVQPDTSGRQPSVLPIRATG